MYALSIDTETTSIDGYIIELAAILFLNGEEILRKQWILDPCHDIDPGASKIHGYGISKPVGVQRFNEISSDYIDLINTADTILVYSADFEWRTLLREFDRAGIHAQPSIRKKMVDVLKMARSFLKLPKNRLQDVVQYLKIDECGEFHGAMADALYSAKVYFKLTSGDYVPWTPDVNTKSEDLVYLSSDVKIGSEIEKSIPSIVKKTAAFKVSTTEEAVKGITALLKIRRMISEVELERKVFLEKRKAEIKSIEDDIRTRVLAPLNEAYDSLNKTLNEFYTMKHNLLLVELPHDPSEEEIDEFAEKSSKPIIIFDGGYKVSFDYEVSIENDDSVPEVFKKPDIKLIEKYAHTHGPSVKIDGVNLLPKAKFK